MTNEKWNLFFAEIIKEDVKCEKCSHPFKGEMLKREYIRKTDTEVIYHDAFNYYNDTIGEVERLCAYVTCPKCNCKQCLAKVILNIKNERPREHV